MKSAISESNLELAKSNLKLKEWNLLFRKASGGQNGRGGKQIPFIIKRASKQSDIVYLTSTNTANAYNQKGGESVYTRYAIDKNPTVSFERPRNVHFRTRPLNLWMDNQEFGHRVISDFDMDDYSELEGSRLLIVAGHNEYWTEEARDNFDRFITEGGSVLILSGNFMYRQVEYPTHDSLKILGSRPGHGKHRHELLVGRTRKIVLGLRFHHRLFWFEDCRPCIALFRRGDHQSGGYYPHSVQQ